MWNTSTDQIVWTSTASERVHRGAITALSFSPDGEYLVSSGADDLVLVWNVSHVGTAGWDAWRLDLPAGTDDPRAAFVGARSIEVFTEGARMVYAIDVVQSSEGWVMRERRLY
ncbi:MAG: WD domain, G-beta repeat [bacterium ADurb.Bin400]|nr:MAG: WD domain, G-beta repeat [bacterium ADurb.Bin400]